MSVISLMFIIGIVITIKRTYSDINNIDKKVYKLRCEFEHTKDDLDEKIKDTVDSTMVIMSDLKVDIAELKESIKGVSSYLTDLKQDIRDLRKK